MIEIKKDGDITSYAVNWEKAVIKPLNEGNFKEAFSMADSLIDSEVESLLREIYNDAKCQDLINEIHYLRGRVNFDGLVLLEILKSKTVVEDSIVDRIREFKKARNLVLHNFEGHYKLIKFSEFKRIKDEDYGKVAEGKALYWVKEAYNLWIELMSKFKEIKKREKEYYTSYEFYKKNPRGKMIEKSHPSIKKFEKSKKKK